MSRHNETGPRVPQCQSLGSASPRSLVPYSRDRGARDRKLKTPSEDPKRKLSRESSKAKFLKLKIPNESSQAKDAKRHVPSDKCNTEDPKRKFPSERSEAKDPKRKIPSNSVQATAPKRQIPNIICQRKLRTDRAMVGFLMAPEALKYHMDPH